MTIVGLIALALLPSAIFVWHGIGIAAHRGRSG